MASITRRGFFGRVGTLPAVGLLFRAGAAKGAQLVESWEGGEVRNAAFRVSLSPKDGLRNTRVVHVPTVIG
jgi:hypothetical protein